MLSDAVRLVRNAGDVSSGSRRPDWRDHIDGWPLTRRAACVQIVCECRPALRGQRPAKKVRSKQTHCEARVADDVPRKQPDRVLGETPQPLSAVVGHPPRAPPLDSGIPAECCANRDERTRSDRSPMSVYPEFLPRHSHSDQEEARRDGVDRLDHQSTLRAAWREEPVVCPRHVKRGMAPGHAGGRGRSDAWLIPQQVDADTVCRGMLGEVVEPVGRGVPTESALPRDCRRDRHSDTVAEG